jgi:DNA-binding NarL/FixJ family response regulator
VPAPRLLVLADPKMLPALAGGLRDGGRFDVNAVSLADAAAAQAAAAGADAVALFYGSPGAPLATPLQALAPKIRERGGRVVAVLQREQAGQRDDCFRAGAGDVLFMPTPKDQFVERLAASVALVFAAGDGAPAAVAVATRTASSRLDRATVSLTGIESPAQLPLKAGETVRLSWGTFQIWGLVVRGAPSTQIRFAGLTPEEEGKIREWLKSGAQQQPASAQASTPRPPSAPRPPVMPVQATSAPPRPTPTPQAGSPPVRPSPPPPQAAQPAVAPRAAPVAGPPPGFMDRKTARPPVPPPHAPAPRPAPRASNGGGLTSLIDAEGPAPAPAARPPQPAGPPWPVPVAIDVCKKAAMLLLQGANPGRDIPPNVAASARKLTALLSLGERASIEKSGIDSHFVHALGARIALEVATAEGTRLASANVSPMVDEEAMASLTKLADEAAGRLQKEANTAIGKGEVENLQLVTAASASLSRDLLNLKETADRLRGVGVGPRHGGGMLDPEVLLHGQHSRPRPLPTQTLAPVKPELRDFRGLDERPGRAKGVLAVFLLAVCAGLAVYSFHFALPHHVLLEAGSAESGVQRVDVTGPAAVVTITPQWLAASETNLPKLVQLLRGRQVKKAVLMLPNGAAAGIVDVATGKATGMPPSAL